VHEHQAASRDSLRPLMDTYVVYWPSAVTMRSSDFDVFAAMVDNCLGVENRGPMSVVGAR
jgi:hypothetical protein